MSTYTLTDGIVDAFCALLKPYVHPTERIPGTKREDGIMVMFNKTDIGLLMFRFVHKEMLEIQLPLELDRLRKEGKDYLHGRIELMLSSIPKALEERQDDHRIYVDSPNKDNSLVSAAFADHGNRKQGVVH